MAIAWFNAGVRLFDLTNPTEPSLSSPALVGAGVAETAEGFGELGDRRQGFELELGEGGGAQDADDDDLAGRLAEHAADDRDAPPVAAQEDLEAEVEVTLDVELGKRPRQGP